MKIAAALITAAAALTALSANAGIAKFERAPEWEKLSHVQAGLTKDEVRELAGRPDVADVKDARGELWMYEAMNEYGELAEYDVTFGPDGKVRDVFSSDVR